MISILQGEVIEATPLSVVVDAGGVGYEVSVPVSTAEKIPPVGRRVKLYIHDVYREDDQALYGFSTREERDFFRMLIDKVSGIGPRTALALLSKLSIAMITSAVAAGDTGLLAKTPGIGKKTAERIVIELRDKMVPLTAHNAAAPSGLPSAAAPNPVVDAINALVALGYNLEVADKAVQKAVAKLGREAPTEALLKAALSAG
ncbi:MAG TPA: Holliday junction branch migration protein RuvA [Opitutales bacterium]|nr:Holliday junction branch migration protein RuvA [Opitutales bacterium]